MSPEVLRTQAAIHSGWRWRIVASAPTVLVDYLLEILMAALGLIYGIAQLTGFSTSILTTTLPHYVVWLDAVALLLAAFTIILGLARARYGTVLPLGLRLLAVTCIAYAGALLGFFGLRGALFTIGFLVTTATLCLWRSFLLRTTFLLLADEANANGVT